MSACLRPLYSHDDYRCPMADGTIDRFRECPYFDGRNHLDTPDCDFAVWAKERREYDHKERMDARRAEWAKIVEDIEQRRAVRRAAGKGK